MRRVVLSELVHRRSRTLGAAARDPRRHRGLHGAHGTSETQRLEARGTVERSFRGDYDVLVRPWGSRSEIERRTGQAPPNFLSELSEGITHSQWRRIQRLPGVEVAAPIANVGYVFRETDYVAVIATILLGVGAVADVLFLGLRKRAPELATLEASGWDDRALGRLVTLEGLWIGALGALAGAGLGLAGAAALVPAVGLRRAPTVPLLAGE